MKFRKILINILAIGMLIFVLDWSVRYVFNEANQTTNVNAGFIENLLTTQKGMRKEKLILQPEEAIPTREIFQFADKGGQHVDKIRNPFSIIVLPDKPEVLKVIGISFDAGIPVAIINHYVVKEGDYIKKFKVIKVTKDKVILFDGKNSIDLKF